MDCGRRESGGACRIVTGASVVVTTLAVESVVVTTITEYLKHGLCGNEQALNDLLPWDKNQSEGSRYGIWSSIFVILSHT